MSIEANSGQVSERIPPAALALIAVMILAGTLKLPYGYFTLLRLVVCGSAAFEGYSGLMTNRKGIVPWLAIGIALLFNPLIPVHLHKADWEPIDVAVGLCYAGLAFVRFRLDRRTSQKK